MSVPTAVFCNAGPLMALGKLNRLDLLSAMAKSRSWPWDKSRREHFCYWMISRREARRLQLQAKGTLGVLVEASQQHKLTQPQLELLLEEIAQRPDIWISKTLCLQVLAQLPDLMERRE